MVPVDLPRELAARREALDASGARAIGPHVTLFYPFIEPSRLDAGVLERLNEALSALPPFEFVLQRTGRFTQGVLYLAPEPERAFTVLAGRLEAAFPDREIGDKRRGEFVPHVTIGRGRDVTLDRAAEEVTALLPVPGRVDEVWVMVGRDETGRWNCVAAVPLAG